MKDELAEILKDFAKRPFLIVAFVICFCVWAYFDHIDKRYFADTVHGDLINIQMAIQSNTATLSQVQIKLAEREK